MLFQGIYDGLKALLAHMSHGAQRLLGEFKQRLHAEDIMAQQRVLGACGKVQILNKDWLGFRSLVSIPCLPISTARAAWLVPGWEYQQCIQPHLAPALLVRPPLPPHVCG